VDVLKSIIHLLFGSAQMAVSWMGTTILGVAVLVGPFLIRLVAGYRTNRGRGVYQALRYASLYQVVVWAAIFLICVGKFIYQDHTFLVTTNAALAKELRSQKSASPFAISVDNEYASITNTMQAFRFLMPQQTETCSVRITAPRENIPIAKILDNLASIFCQVDMPYNPYEPDDEVLRGSVKDAILVHMPKDPKREGLIVALGNSFSVRRSYEMPPGSPNRLVWLQIGQGLPWRKDPTKSGAE
jgi:hypothetical protein